ncbi:ribosome rescue protein RqcH [Stetteria hydrogenophila]
MSNIDLHAVTARLSRLSGARLANFYEEQGVYLARLKGAGEELVVIEPGVRMHATRRLKPSGGVQRDRLSLLARKWLRGLRLEGVRQLDFDRVAFLEFKGGWRLYVELVPRGVAALVSPDGVIVGASRYVEMRDRAVRPGVKYEPPPPSGSVLPDVDPGVLRDRLRGQRDVVRGLVRGLGLPGEAAEEAAFRAGVEPQRSPEELSPGELEALAEAVASLIREAGEGRGYRAVRRGEPLEAAPFRLTKYEGSGDVEVYEYQSIDEALDDHFYHLAAAGGASAGGQDQERARLERALEEARRTAESYREKARELRAAAEAVASNYHAVAEALECARRAWRSRGAGECPGVAEADYGRGVVTLDVAGVRVKARIGESVDKLIVRLYAEAGEYEAKAERALKSVQEAEARLRELERRAELSRLAARVRARKRYWFEKYHWIVTRNGFLAVGGRDASQNESVVKRYLGEKDIFMHADIHGAPAVVLLTRGRTPPEEDLVDAAYIAAAYSRAWRAGLGSVSVYWAWGSQVSKSPPSGEYLARGAFMVYGRKNYLPPIPLQLAVGLAVDNEQQLPIVIAGPEDLVARRSLAYALLAPGDEGVEAVAGKVKEAWASKLEYPDSLLAEAIPLDEVKQRIPGRSRVLKIARGRGEGFNPPSEA